jgi:hypothetical protein
MDVGIVPNEGLGDTLKYIVQSPISGVSAWNLYLWKNDFQPTILTVLADIVEATFTGYVRNSLTRATWTAPVVSVDQATSTWGTTPILFTNTGSTTETIYGYAFVDPTLLVLRAIQRLDDCDIQPLGPGAVFSILPKYTLTRQRCP